MSALSSSRPLLCYVTDRSTVASPSPCESVLEKIAAASAAWVDLIQLREKDLSASSLAALARRALRLHPPPRLLLNDRLDVALSTHCAGVHLSERSLPVSEARRIINDAHFDQPHPFLVGVSCHSLDAALVAVSAGADYMFFGPVFATPSKASFGPPQGLARLAEVCRSVSIPVLAIGGITLQNASSCMTAGASGLAAIRLFQDSPDLPALVGTLRSLAP